MKTVREDIEKNKQKKRENNKMEKDAKTKGMVTLALC